MDRVGWDPTLADGLAGGLALGVVGQLGLPAPLSRVLVLARSEGPPGGRMGLAAVLIPALEGGTFALNAFGLLHLAGAGRIPGEVSTRFATRPGEGGFYVLDGDGSEQYLVAPGLLRQITVSCGAWPLLLPLVGPRAEARPVLDRTRLELDLDAFCALLTALLVAIYRRQGTPMPSFDLRLRPGPAGLETVAGALNRLGEEAGRLISWIPGLERAGPGRGYAPGGGEDAAVTFADVGGQDPARAELETVCLALRDPGAFQRWGARPPRGVLLFGPPGTGKTLLARALAHEANARFLQVRLADLVSKWYGEAEQRVQQVFDQARAAAPAVLFFDEVDALARDRDDSHEATHRMVSTFLENMDGLRELAGVVVLAATNRPGSVDDALLRPGRFDRLIEVPLPDREGRRAIFRLHMGHAARRAGRPLFDPLGDLDWARLLDLTEGYSGADVAEIVRRVLEAKVRSGASSGQVAPEELAVAATGLVRPF